MPVSEVRRFFDGKPFADWKEGRESEVKTQIAIIDHLGAVIRACNGIAKVTARR